MPLDDNELHAELLAELTGFECDPLGWVYWAFPWGEAGTELERYTGPEPWQVELLTDLGSGCLGVNEAIALARAKGEEMEATPLRFARCSGHGIGKSACVSWIILWAISTFPDTKGVITANTENQLKTKTWAEVAKWHRLFLARSLFKMTRTALFSADPDYADTWRIDMVPWSEKNTEAFAGLHNQGKRILLIYDEASAIADAIWETSEGAMTDKNTQIIWVCFGNPTQSTGRFRECFPGGKFEARWDTRAIDSREVSFTNKKQIADWIADWGEDSDFIRIRVRGMFPRVDAVSFISYDLALEATRRKLPDENPNAVVLGVDCARYGDDKSVIYPRKGLDARTLQPRVFSKISSTALAREILRAYHDYNAAAVFVDIGNVGAAVVDMLIQMEVTVYEVDFGSGASNSDPADRHTSYANKRSEIWGALSSWLSRGGCIPEDIPGCEESLPTELSTPTYFYRGKREALYLEAKADIRRRGFKSPDASDALACTFAESFADRLRTGSAHSSAGHYSEPSPYDEDRFHA